MPLPLKGRWLAAPLVLALLAATPQKVVHAGAVVTVPVPQAGLAARIDSLLERPEARRAHWGIEVRDAASGRVLYERNAERLFTPASTLKLVVSATAAHHLAPDHRWRTTLRATGPVRGGVLRGDLVLAGEGDPTISGRYWGGRRTAVWETLADSLRARGITRVAGAVVGDDSAWDADRLRGDWELYDTRWWYAAPVGALGFNDNAVDFRVEPGTAAGEPARIRGEPASSFWSLENRTRTVAAGGANTLDFERVPGTRRIRAYGQIPLGTPAKTESFAVEDPARWAATVFRETLVARGIAVDSPEVRVVSAPAAPPAGTVLVTWLSRPLPDVIGPILLNSQNWFAEQLLRTVALRVRGEGSWGAGLAVERDFLFRVVGVDSTQVVLRDASGLSSGNLVTPRAMVRLLDYVRRTPRQEVVRRSLPVAGRTGSLRARLADLEGRVAAKTGYVGNMDTLAGFVTLADGREVIFYVAANQSGQPSARVRAVIDDVVRAIAAVG